MSPNSPLNFLKDDLDNYAIDGDGLEKRLVIITHYGVMTMTNKQREKLWKIFKTRGLDTNVVAFLHGHNHNTSKTKFSYTDDDDTFHQTGVPVFNMGSPYIEHEDNGGRGHFSVFKINNDGDIKGYDVSWKPPQGQNPPPECLGQYEDNVDANGVYSLPEACLKAMTIGDQWSYD